MTTSKSLNKIILFCNSLEAAGGEQRLLWEEEKFFRAKGIETTVLTFSLDRSALYDYQPKRIEVIKAGSSHISRVIALRQKLQQINPDMVIASSNWNAVYLYLATLFTSISYIVHIHGSLFWFREDILKYALIYKGILSEIRESLIGHKEFIPERPLCSFKRRMASEFFAILDYFVVRHERLSH